MTLTQLFLLEERVESQTLGRLLRETRRHVDYGTGAQELLETALERRMGLEAASQVPTLRGLVAAYGRTWHPASLNAIMSNATA